MKVRLLLEVVSRNVEVHPRVHLFLCVHARATHEIPVTQTLTSCQMLPVTVTGSAFDRKIVSVLPVPFHVFVSCIHRARVTRKESQTNTFLDGLFFCDK